MGRAWEDAVHDLSAAFDDRAELLAVDGSVTMVERWPTSREMFSTGIFASDSTDTKLCRNSRGARSLPTSPAASTTFRKSRRTLRASRGLPVRVMNTRQEHSDISA
jgi:hypothetical protein